MQQSNALVLEIARQGTQLAMSISEQSELASTIKYRSISSISYPQIATVCQEIRGILNKARRPVSAKSELNEELQKAGQLLWDHLFTREIKNRLKTTPHRNLVLSIDEELIYIPWELIYDGSDFFCLKFNIGRLILTKEYSTPARYRGSSERLKMLIVANPTADLKSAYQEGLNIKNQFDRERKEISISFKSTHIDTLYVKKNLREYDIVHFAGHCEYDSDTPSNSGWVLSDGRFTSKDIFALAEGLSLPALVFSNACHSAHISDDVLDTSYQEKTYSLASAFLFAGVRHYIGAIWNIEDTVSLVFAREFYRYLIKGESVGVCSRLAREKLIKDYGKDTLCWTSYILYGDPNHVLFKNKPKPERKTPAWKLALARSKKLHAAGALCASLIAAVLLLSRLIPSLHPSTYYLFHKSQKLFAQGENVLGIDACNKIIRNDPAFLAAFPLLGDSYYRMGDTDKAVQTYYEYALESEKKQDKNNLASAYIGIGRMYQISRQDAKSFDFYQKALSLSRLTRDRPHEAESLRKLAVWYIDKQEYQRALELLMQSSEINRELKFSADARYNLACDYFDIGLVFVKKDDTKTAREFYAKSSRLFEKMKLRQELRDYYTNLGEISLFEKQFQTALDYYLKGLGMDLRHAHKPNLLSDYTMLGELYVEMGNMSEAEKYFEQAVAVGKQVDLPWELALSYYDLGLVYKQRGQNNRAVRFFRLAQEIYVKTDLSAYEKIKKEYAELE